MTSLDELSNDLNTHVRPQLEALAERANREQWRIGHLYVVKEDTFEEEIDGDLSTTWSLRAQCNNCRKIGEMNLVGAACLELAVMLVRIPERLVDTKQQPTWCIYAHLTWHLPPDLESQGSFEAEGANDYSFVGTNPDQDCDRLVDQLKKLMNDFETGVRRGLPLSTCRRRQYGWRFR